MIFLWFLLIFIDCSSIFHWFVIDFLWFSLIFIDFALIFIDFDWFCFAFIVFNNILYIFRKVVDFHWIWLIFIVFWGFGASCVAFGRLWAPSLPFWNDSKHLESVFGGFVGGLGGPKGVSRGARECAWWSLGALWTGPVGPWGCFLRVHERD